MTKELKTEKSNSLRDKAELEDFFLDCVNEVKKDIQKRLDGVASKQSVRSTKISQSSMSVRQPKLT